MHDQMPRYEQPLWALLFLIFSLLLFGKDSLFYHLTEDESIIFRLPLFLLSTEYKLKERRNNRMPFLTKELLYDLSFSLTL